VGESFLNRRIIVDCALVMALALTSTVAGAQQTQPNVLLLIADDVGVEQFAPFGIGSNPASTPTLDALAARGMRFSRVWSQAMCSPTRATLLSGRYGFRTGVGSGTSGPGVSGPYPGEEPVVREQALHEVHERLEDALPYINVYNADQSAPRQAFGLGADEVALPAQLRTAPIAYSTAAIGKWHLGSLSNGWLEHPGRLGFDFFSVLMLNEPESYFAWRENVNGVLEERHTYTPERKIDDALNWISSQGDQPWFLWLAFNLVHFPHHIPDVEHLDTAGVDPADPHAALDVMLAKLDQEIGRLLAGIGEDALENTIVVFVGDNGTTGLATDLPFHRDRAKFTLYEGGLRVPLIIAGPGIPENRASRGLVNTTDIYTTITDLAGAPRPEGTTLDSISLAPYFEDPDRPSLREWLYADAFFSPQGVRSGGYAVRDERYKLMRLREQTELFDVEADIGETTNLLADGISEAEQAKIDSLQRIADTLHDSGAHRTEID
jgi:arylsulfatase A-like enzyme